METTLNISIITDLNINANDKNVDLTIKNTKCIYDILGTSNNINMMVNDSESEYI